MTAPDMEHKYHDWPEDEIEEGEIIRQSPITGDLYRVTRWVERGEGRVIALEKELVKDE